MKFGYTGLCVVATLESGVNEVPSSAIRAGSGGSGG